MWTCRCLGVVLDAEGWGIEQPEPLDHVVVETDMADLSPAVRRLRHVVEWRVDGEAVVVGTDLDLAGQPVLDSRLMPRCPYLSLYVPKPSARPRI